MKQVIAKSSLVTIVTTAHLFLSFYIFGALVIENEVNYYTWRFISADDFSGYHQALESQLGTFFFLPMTILAIFNTLFIWFRPAQIKRGPILASLIFIIYIIIESLLVQVPLHTALQENKSDEILDQLLRTHFIFRLPAEIIFAIINIYITGKIISSLEISR